MVQLDPIVKAYRNHCPPRAFGRHATSQISGRSNIALWMMPPTSTPGQPRWTVLTSPDIPNTELCQDKPGLNPESMDGQSGPPGTRALEPVKVIAAAWTPGDAGQSDARAHGAFDAHESLLAARAWPPAATESVAAHLL
jgi:hypothetical protein